MASIKSIIARSRLFTRCRRRLNTNRHFSQSTRCMVNPLLNLSHFSAAKEAQFLSKERKIPREEFHPYLQLIRSSEVDPFAPVPGASPTVIAALEKAKAGKTDTETTYNLAVSNLMSQVELSRRENLQVTSALMMIQERHKREERNALLFMLAAVGLLSFIMLKTRALEDLKDYAWGRTHDVGDFDRQRLNSQSSRVVSPRQSLSTPMQDLHRASFESLTPLRRKTQTETKPAQPTQPAKTEVLLPASSIPSSQNSGWRLSRLFWAS